MGGFWGEEAILRPFLHWQCQLGTVPYTVPYFTVITVKYGVIITVVRRNLTSTVRTVQTVIVPYNSTSLNTLQPSSPIDLSSWFGGEDPKVNAIYLAFSYST